MSWLKRIEPIVLEQSSDIPYVVLENGVFLCASNFFVEEADELDHFLKLKASKNDLLRKSTNCCVFRKFPKLIPFEDIIALDDVVAEGRVIKIASTQLESPKNIVVARSECLHEMDDTHFQEFMERVDDYDHKFLLVGDEISSQDRILQGIMSFITHGNWYKTSIAMLDNIYKTSYRKYCWTRLLPELKMTLYGLRDTEEAEEITSCLESIGVTENEITWI